MEIWTDWNTFDCRVSRVSSWNDARRELQFYCVKKSTIHIGVASVGSPWNATAKSTQQTPTIQQKDELESGRRAKRLYLRQNILDTYGRTAKYPGCLGIGQNTRMPSKN